MYTQKKAKKNYKSNIHVNLRRLALYGIGLSIHHGGVQVARRPLRQYFVLEPGRV